MKYLEVFKFMHISWSVALSDPPPHLPSTSNTFSALVLSETGVHTCATCCFIPKCFNMMMMTSVVAYCSCWVVSRTCYCASSSLNNCCKCTNIFQSWSTCCDKLVWESLTGSVLFWGSRLLLWLQLPSDPGLDLKWQFQVWVRLNLENCSFPVSWCLSPELKPNSICFLMSPSFAVVV